MCANCVASGAAYAVPVLVGLKAYAARGRRRRLSPPLAPGDPVGEDRRASATGSSAQAARARPSKVQPSGLGSTLA